MQNTLLLFYLPTVIFVILIFFILSERKRHRRLRELQNKAKQSIEEDSHEDSNSDREHAQQPAHVQQGQQKARKLGTCYSLGETPTCNGLPFTSYVDPSKSLDSAEISTAGERGTTHDTTVLDMTGNDRVSLDDRVISPRVSVSSAVSQPDAADGLTHPDQSSGPNSTNPPNPEAPHVAQDVNQNITQSERTPDKLDKPPEGKRKGSITFVITDHSQEDDDDAFTPKSAATTTTPTLKRTPAVDYSSIPKSAFSRKTSACESIPEENGRDLGTGGPVQTQLHGSNLQLPPPTIRKSGRSMSECSDYSMSSDGKGFFYFFNIFPNI